MMIISRALIRSAFNGECVYYNRREKEKQRVDTISTIVIISRLKLSFRTLARMEEVSKRVVPWISV